MSGDGNQAATVQNEVAESREEMPVIPQKSADVLDGADLARLLRIEAAAREIFALDKGGCTNVDAWEQKYEALRLALGSLREGG